MGEYHDFIPVSIYIYIYKTPKNQLNAKNVYEELTGNVEGPLEKSSKLFSKKSEIGETLVTAH